MKNRPEELLAVGILGTSKLGDRIEMLLKRGRDFSPRASLGRVAVTAIALLAITLVGARAPRWIAFAQQQAPRPSFEVASIKPDDSSDPRFFIGFQPGGRFNANAPLKMLISVAYDVQNHQIAGGPNWLESARFNIEAKPESAMPPPGPAFQTQMRLMLQSMLEDRFKLALHRETREEQVYDLVVAKGGSKLKKATETQKKNQQGMGIRRGQLNGSAAPIVMLANTLSQQLGRPVIDKTGLTATYDFSLTYTPEPGQGGGFGPPGPDAPPPPDPNGPSIFTALQEQLGLRLESAKGPVDVLVIDHAEKPDAN
ncbi:MAG TPA: TIGR03435 family protein [Bryobacteraceae bacterium]|nr:TIGR03435 family protein [Bryobacteraceae bacterium]